MKIFLPPLVTILVTLAFDIVIDIIFNYGPYDDSGTPGLVFQIEVIIISGVILLGFLIHGLIIVKTVEKLGRVGYIRVIGWGMLVILIICGFYLFVIMEDLNYPLKQKVINGIRLFSTLLIILITDLYSLKLIKNKLPNAMLNHRG